MVWPFSKKREQEVEVPKEIEKSEEALEALKPKSNLYAYAVQLKPLLDDIDVYLSPSIQRIAPLTLQYAQAIQSVDKSFNIQGFYHDLQIICNMLHSGIDALSFISGVGLTQRINERKEYRLRLNELQSRYSGAQETLLENAGTVLFDLGNKAERYPNGLLFQQYFGQLSDIKRENKFWKFRAVYDLLRNVDEKIKETPEVNRLYPEFHPKIMRLVLELSELQKLAARWVAVQKEYKAKNEEIRKEFARNAEMGRNALHNANIKIQQFLAGTSRMHEILLDKRAIGRLLPPNLISSVPQFRAKLETIQQITGEMVKEADNFKSVWEQFLKAAA